MYLAVAIDLSSRRAVGWSIAKRMKKQLVMDAIRSAFIARRPPTGLMFHSGRGSQYAYRDFTNQLQRYGMIQSMSIKGNCRDNAVAERFFISLKEEQINRFWYETRDEPVKDVFDYIELFYNQKRLHSTLGYMSPAAFEAQAFIR